jgi:hypothetical protein
MVACPPGSTTTNSADFDYLEFTLPTDAVSMIITATFTHASGNLQLELWDGSAFGFVDYAYSTTDNEEIIVNGTIGGDTYVLSVFLQSGTGNDDGDAGESLRLGYCCGGQLGLARRRPERASIQRRGIGRVSR